MEAFQEIKVSALCTLSDTSSSNRRIQETIISILSMTRTFEARVVFRALEKLRDELMQEQQKYNMKKAAAIRNVIILWEEYYDSCRWLDLYAVLHPQLEFLSRRMRQCIEIENPKSRERWSQVISKEVEEKLGAFDASETGTVVPRGGMRRRD